MDGTQAETFINPMSSITAVGYMYVFLHKLWGAPRKDHAYSSLTIGIHVGSGRYSDKVNIVIDGGNLATLICLALSIHILIESLLYSANNYHEDLNIFLDIDLPESYASSSDPLCYTFWTMGYVPKFLTSMMQSPSLAIYATVAKYALLSVLLSRPYYFYF